MNLLIENGLGDEGVIYLSSALKVNSTITQLKISGKPENSSIMIFMTYIVFNLLIGNYVGDEGAKCLGEALKVNTGLTQLALSRTQGIV